MNRRHAAVIVAAVLAAYLNAFAGAFQFDDYNVIVDNPLVHSVGAWWHSMPGIRPLLKLSYALNWSSGLGVAGFHAVNLLCHLGSALLVYALTARLLREQADANAIALATALLFALHPAQTEAVTYVSGRSVSLMGVLYLAAVLTWLVGHERNRVWLRDGASPLLFMAALATRETAWTLPFALLLVTLTRPSTRLRTALPQVRVHLAVLGIAAVAMLATPGYQRLLAGSIEARTLKDNLLTQIDGVCYLISRPLLLLHTNMDPDLPVHVSLTPVLGIKGVVLVALIATGLMQLRRRPWLGVGILWFFLHLAPTNSLLPRLDIANDRQLYLALIGPAWLVAMAMARALERPLSQLTASALAVLLGIATALRNDDYRSEVALWQATVRDSPRKARAWNNLGYAYQVSGADDPARLAYQRALALDPEQINAHFNLQALSRSDRAPR